jgi:signal transduction histidine kinase
MKGTAEEVQLVVRDAGAGFDVEEAKRNRGLGLVSMQDRVNLVHGRFSVESKPGAGTTIVAIAPLLAANGSLTDGDGEQAGSMAGAA